MKSILLVVFFVFSVVCFGQNRGIWTEPMDESTRISLSLNLGDCFFNPGTTFDERFSSGLHVSGRFGYHLLRTSKLLNGSIGFQFAEDGVALTNEKVILDNGEITYQDLNVDEFGGVQLKFKSIGIPLLISIHARDVNFLNRFKLEFGFIPSYNFRTVNQGITYVDNEVNYKQREKFELDQPLFRFSLLGTLSYKNFAFFYEHGLQPGFSGMHFNAARSTVGGSFFIRI